MARAMLERLESKSPPEPKPVAAEVDLVRSEIGELRDLVGQVLRHQTMSFDDENVPSGIPEKMVCWYVDLISSEVSKELATRVIEAASQELGGNFDDRDHVRDRIIHHLSRFVPTASSPLPDPPADGPLVIAMVGPTGVGKTTTTAKIAATCRLHRGGKVALVTCDTYRVAAVAQLRTYAEILGIPLHVAEHPGQLPRLMEAMRDVDVVIIDTPGRSQRDEDRIDELNLFLEAARPHQTHLVLSGTAGEKVLLREAEAFLPLGVDRIVLTKLDEAVSFGMLVDVLHRIGRELSFVTTGQEVPADIEPASGDRLASMALRGITQDGSIRSSSSVIGDQATMLREMLRRSDETKHRSHDDPPKPRLSLAIAIASGKGGVGKTNVTVNLATALAQQGLRTIVFDADLGTANADVLCGLDPMENIEAVVAGRRTLREIMVTGPGGFELIPGTSGGSELSSLSPERRQSLLRQLGELESEADVLLIDVAAGVGTDVMGFASAADALIVVATPEPTSVTDAYAFIKSIRRHAPERVPDLLINASDSDEEARRFIRGWTERAVSSWTSVYLWRASSPVTTLFVGRSRPDFHMSFWNPHRLPAVRFGDWPPNWGGRPARDSLQHDGFLGRLMQWLSPKRPPN